MSLQWRTESDERTKRSVGVVRRRPDEDIQISSRSRSAVSRERMGTNNDELAALDSQALQEVDEVLGRGVRHRAGRMIRPGISARV
jgi:hypothetical protein